MLECRDLSVSYGHHRALDGVSMNIKPGEIVVILGANGAGKSTLLRSIAGLIDYDDSDDDDDDFFREKSEILMGGNSIYDWDSHQVVEVGLSMVPEGRALFGELTVLENLLLGAYPQRARAEQSNNLDRVMAIFPKLAERRSQIAHTMSGGEQQMVAVGRAMMSAPTILMLDEPSLGLSPILCSELFKALVEIRETGVGILLVEQNAKQSLAIADRGYLLETGRITGEDTAEELANDQAVLRAYLGGATRIVTSTQKRHQTNEILNEDIATIIDRASKRQTDHIKDLRAKKD
jgi:branched-chain amino acid transport system ATP-binding protein